MQRKRPTWCFCRGRLTTGRAEAPGKPVRFGADFRVRETAASAGTYASTNSKGTDALSESNGPTRRDQRRVESGPAGREGYLRRSAAVDDRYETPALAV